MRFLALFIIFSLFASGSQAISFVPADKKPIVTMKMNGSIGPAYTKYLKSGLRLAKANEAQLLIIQLNSSGGLLSPTIEIADLILKSAIPIAVYVSPEDASAATAGIIITMSGHIAAMNNESTIGMAMDIKSLSSKDNILAPDDFVRMLAETRGRSTEWVDNANIIKAGEALDKKFIDIIAENRNILLEKIDGKEIKLSNGEVVILDLEDAREIAFDPDFITRFLSFLTNPNLALILIMIGIYGLLLEFYNPTTFVAGAIGAISLTLGLFAINILPINEMGIILLLLGLVFLLAENFIPSFGILGLGGIISFLIGASIMFDGEEMIGMEVTYDILIVLGISGLLIILLSLYLTYKAYNKSPSSGVESMLGKKAEVIEWSECDGKVRFQGEIWEAYSDEKVNLSKKDKVTISKVEDLQLKIIS